MRNLRSLFFLSLSLSSIAVPKSPVNKYDYTFYVAARNGGVCCAAGTEVIIRVPYAKRVFIPEKW